jgi:hypothetical protein
MYFVNDRWYYFKVHIKCVRIFIWLPEWSGSCIFVTGPGPISPLSDSEYSFLLLLRCFDASIAICLSSDYPCQYCRSYKCWDQSYSGNKSKYETSTTPFYRRICNIFPVFMKYFLVTSPPSGLQAILFPSSKHRDLTLMLRKVGLMQDVHQN